MMAERVLGGETSAGATTNLLRANPHISGTLKMIGKFFFFFFNFLRKFSIFKFSLKRFLKKCFGPSWKARNGLTHRSLKKGKKQAENHRKDCFEVMEYQSLSL